MIIKGRRWKSIILRDISLGAYMSEYGNISICNAEWRFQAKAYRPPKML